MQCVRALSRGRGWRPLSGAVYRTGARGRGVHMEGCMLFGAAFPATNAVVLQQVAGWMGPHPIQSLGVSCGPGVTACVFCRTWLCKHDVQPCGKGGWATMGLDACDFDAGPNHVPVRAGDQDLCERRVGGHPPRPGHARADAARHAPPMRHQHRGALPDARESCLAMCEQVNIPSAAGSSMLADGVQG